MTAKDKIPLSTVCNSEEIRLGLLARGYCDIPKLPEGIRLRVRAHHVFVAGLYRNELVEMKKQDRKISITNMNAQSNQRTWNLGLQRIVGSMNAEKCVRKKLLEEVLSDYDLSFSEDVVAATTDGGAYLMKKKR